MRSLVPGVVAGAFVLVAKERTDVLKTATSPQNVDARLTSLHHALFIQPTFQRAEPIAAYPIRITACD